MAQQDSKDQRKADVLASALSRTFGEGTMVEVDGADVYVARPGAEYAEHYHLSHSSWEVLDAAVERDVPLEKGTVIDLLAPGEDS